jgi:DNA-binding transcriptional LysR family regulator
MEAHGIQRGHLRIAAVGPYNVMPVLARFRGWYPGIQITLSVGDSRDIVDRVLNFEADIGVLCTRRWRRARAEHALSAAGARGLRAPSTASRGSLPSA